ncbi:MAG: PilW family protein [Thermodesulfobacteriota bacterium]|nr:PilW family protein [Thermodesulfobacteriota bacterium]
MSPEAGEKKGFTLVELMIVMAVSTIVMTGIYTVYNTQQKSFVTQEEVAGMQQNLRAAMYFMEREIMSAGADPSKTAGATIVTSGSTTINFTMDITDNAGTGNPDDDVNDANENITYGFNAADDANGDGIADAGAAPLRRNNGGGLQPFIEGVHAIGFAYAYDTNPGDGFIDTAGGNVIWAVPNAGGGWNDLDANGDGAIDAADDAADGVPDGVLTGVSTGDTVNTADIRSVRIWVLVRSDREVVDYRNTNTYVVGRQVITPNDGFRRRLLSTIVQCRNMGLQ